MAENEDPNTLRLVIVFLRFYARLTQAELGKAAGVEQALISRYETGPQQPPEESVRRMAAAVDVPWPLVMYLRRFYSALLRLLAQERAEADCGLDALDGMLDRILASLAPHLAEALAELETLAVKKAGPSSEDDRSEAEQIWTNLRPFSKNRRRRVIDLMGVDSPNWALAERICESSREAAAVDPGEALELAELALSVAGSVEGEEGWRSRVAGYCWAHIGYARRAAADGGVREAFARAWALWQAGSDTDPRRRLDEERIVDLEKS
jgi:transcriptional regulator with XRE-family HTH domain